ncbi:PKD domain-containing protein [Flavobacterium sp. AS60]|uniref:BNR-repeat neuraminidase N-terminal domain-containing protein n=1 Tax=Flavobacterium anseongense TaxID=2910677 RepID=UPI001F378030|nr:BNR-repeat neuraminidase N-terminal domain-containing protein [Flavobacterium sp. AS60]MCF6130412.1 PKD domain-containing protein [Flavobacterium sp. AS60]
MMNHYTTSIISKAVAITNSNLKTKNTKSSNTIKSSWMVGVLLMVFGVINVNAQVGLTATAGTATGSFTTLGAAFTAINAGTHRGDIVISISANTTETAACVLNSSGAGSAVYTSINIRPTTDGVTISGPTVTGRGLIELNGADNVTIDGDNPNTGGTNRNLTITNTAATTVTYTSVIRIALSTLITSADNVIVRNCIINGNATAQITSSNTSATTGSVGSSHGILLSGGASTAAVTTAPSAISSNSTTTGSTVTALNFTATNNQISACGKGIYITGSATTVIPTLTISNNTIGNATAGATTGVAWRGISAQGFGGGTISGNTIYVESWIGSTTAPFTSIVGIDLGVISSSGTNMVVEKNTIGRVYQNNTGGYGAIGITLDAGNANTVRNNFIYNVKNIGSSSFSTTYGAQGIRINTGLNHKIYHNTVSLTGSDAGTANLQTCLSISGTGLTGIDVRNNIFSNTMTSSSTSSAFTCLYLPSGGTSTMNLILNNNAYYTGSTANLSAIAQVGTTFGTGVYTVANFNPAATTGSTNLRTYTSTLLAANTNNDNASKGFTTAAPFNSATNLHINTGVSITPLESTGVSTATTGVTTDFDGDARPGPSGSVNGGASAPDLGADEFDGVPLNNMAYSSSTTEQPTTTNVAAGSNNNSVIRVKVVTTGSTSPLSLTSLTLNANGTTAIANINATTAKVYYTGSSTTFATTTLFGSATPTIASFNVTGTQALLEGDNYFWLAYDVVAGSPTGNVIDGECTSITVGSPQTPTVTAPSGSRTIVGTMSGTYLVGAGKSYPNFTTITSAISDLNSRGVSGAVTLSLDTDYVSTSETFPLTFGTVAGVSATNTITVKPATGATPTISGSNATTIFDLSAGKYVTIDGSNTVGGTTKNLTISNTNTSGSVFRFVNDATNNTIKNSILTGVSTSSGNGVITFSVGATTGNDTNIIQNNDISGGATATANGIYNSGSTSSTAIKNSGIQITGNNIFNFSATGITDVGGSVGTVYSGNNIYEVATQTTTLAGILINSTSIEGFTATANKIYDLKTTSTGTVYGIQMVDTITGIASLLANNMIVIDATAPLTAYGIYDNTNTSEIFNIYHNSVSLSGSVSGLSNSYAYYRNQASTSDLKNNIFSNTRAGGTGKHYAIRTIASVGALTSNYNAFYIGGGTGNTILGNNVTSDTADLAAWRTATSKDANSVFGNPQFISATDLHINTSIPTQVESKGTPIAGVTTDFDGDTRNATTPDIGADEGTFTPPATNDIAATAFSNPANGGTNTVGVAFSPQATFTNIGSADQTNIPVRYRIVGPSPAVTEVYNSTKTIASLASGITSSAVSFDSPQATIAATGTYTIYAKAENPGDALSTNDEISGTITVTDPYTSSTTTQTDVSSLGANTQNKQIIGVQVVTGAASGLVTSFTFNTNGSTNANNDISNAKVFYTTNSSTFATGTQFGSTSVSPNGTFTITGSQTLASAGTYYFWLTYDVSSNAIGGNVLDAECTSITVNGITRTPTVTIPSGSRSIVGPMAGPYTIGASGANYITLTGANGALADLSLRGVSAPVSFVLQSDYASAGETYPINIPGNVPGVSSTNTVTLMPATGVTATITGAGTSIFNLNGTQNFIIDGRQNGTGSTNSLTVTNTNTTGTAITFINEASNNTVKYTNLKSDNTSTTSGVVLFSTTTGANGNDGNTITNCNIGPNIASPTNGVYSVGTTTTAATNNSGNTISNNNIFDYFNATADCNGVFLGAGNTDWIISGNSFYQTATRTFTTSGSVFHGIQVTNSSGNNFAVTGNYVGGSQASCAGSPLTIAGNGVIRLLRLTVGTTTPTSVQGNTIQNISFTSSSTSTAQSLIGAVTGSFNIGNVTGNILGSQSTTGSITISISGSAAIFSSILAGTGTPGALNISNNTIGGISVSNTGSPTTGTSVRGIGVQSTPTSLTVSNNTIGSTTTANSLTSSTTSSLLGIFLSTTNTGSVVSNNTIANLSSTSTSSSATVLGISTPGSTGGSFSITGNTVRNLTSSSTNVGTGSAASIIGISLTAATTAGQTVSQNTVYGLSSTDTTLASAVTGIYYAGPTSGTNLIERNLIYSLVVASSSPSATIRGIQFNSGLANVQNNMIRLGQTVANGNTIVGLYEVGSSANSGIYFNSIYIGGSGVGIQTGNTFAFQTDQTTNTRTFQNNIFVNARSNASTGGKHYAVRIAGTTANPAGLTLNYNDYLVTGTGGVFGLFNSIDRVDFAAWKLATGQDANSINADPQFIDATGTTPNLHISTTLSSPIESAGLAVAAVTNDYDGQTRSGLSPTDIGADAGDFASLDLVPPTITYTPLANFCGSGTRVLSATITDLSGVPTSGAGLPVLYWKIGAGAYAASTGTHISGNQYDFTIGTGSLANDVISYYIVAQDNVATPNVSVSPSVGAAGLTANPPSAATPPTTPSTYTNLPALGGTYTVGSGGNYATLTAAVTAYNNSCLTGAVVFTLTDAAYGSETFPITINANATANATNTLTIKPISGVTPTISGSLASGALIKLNGADYVTIDGSNINGGTDRSLTITNSATTAPSVIWLASQGTGAGAINNTIKNCNLSTGVQTSLGYGICIGGSTLPSQGADNDNVTIQNNNITACGVGIYANGTASVSSGGNDNLAITRNTIDYNGSLSSVVGIQVGNGLVSTIDQNSITEQTSAGTTPVGISIESGFVSSSIVRNTISKVNVTASNGWGGRGITVGTGTATSALTIANNFISGVTGSNYTSFGSSSALGIGIGMVGGSSTLSTTTGGVNLYYNTIYLSGSHSYSSATITAGLYVGSGATTLDIRNNIFANSLNNAGTSGSKNYGIYSAAANTAFTNINYNDYHGVSSSNSTFIVGYLGSDRSDIVAWRTASAQDAQSFSQNPQFLSTSDLHINTSVATFVEAAGTPIAGITNDIDGDTRNASTPDVGADEGIFIAPVNNDIAATAFINPATASSKTVGVAFAPQASFTNPGINTQTNVPVRYRIVNSSLVEVYNNTATIASIANGVTTTVTFPSGTVAVAGSYTIYAKAELVGDSMSANDEISGTLTITDPFTSSTTTQNTNSVTTNTTNQQVIGIQVVTSAATATVTSIDFNTTGTSAPLTDITNAKIFYTGTSSTFSAVGQFGGSGATVASPNGSHTVTGTQALALGTNYFWLTYDVTGGATNGNVLDAECTGLTVNGIVRTPSITAPTGVRNIVAPMSGTYLIGASQTFPNFTTLTAANFDLSFRGVSGAVLLELQSDYSGTETLPIAMGAVAGVSATNTVTIKPGAGVTKTISGSNATAIFNLNGAQYVTIDGSNTVGGTTKNLTIGNTNTSGTVVTFINDASNNTIKNTVLNGVGTATTSGVVLLSSGTTNGNDNNIIQNNDISGGATATGIGVNNNSSTTTTAIKNSGNIISNNNIFNFSIAGIRESSGAGTVYSGNKIYEVTTQSTALTGIIVRTATQEGFTFSGNKIYDLKTTSTGSVYGIDLVNMQTATTGIITNNMISLDAPTALTVYGIFDEAGTGRLFDIYYNTVSITGTVTGSSNSAAYYYSIASTTNFKNNIISNTRTGGTGKHYAYRTIASLTSLTSDYNDIYASGGTANVLASNATDQATLSAWQSATGKDSNSLSTLPIFTSTTDLHITNANITLDNLGTPIANVTVDYDGETRSATTPDLGADEFTIPNCVAAVGGTASGSATYCASGTPTITATGFSDGIGTTYQWYSSTNSGDYPNAGSPVVGQSNPTALVTGAVNATTYYWLRVTCATNSSTDNSSLVTITINPTPTATPSSNSPVCSGTTLNLSSGAPVANTTYSWTGPNSFASSDQNPSFSALIASAGTYSLVVTTNGCPSAAATTTVSINQSPSAVTVNASASTVCYGSAVTLSATGGTLSPLVDSTVFSESFNSGIGTFTTVNASSSASINWAPQANGYIYGLTTFSGSTGGFMMANSDVTGDTNTTNTQLVSPSFSTIGYSNLTLQLKEYLNNTTTTAAAIEISDDDFSTSTELRNNITTDIGSASTFASTTISIPSQFQNKSNVKIRFRYVGNYDWYWAVDEVQLKGDLIVNPTITWSASSGVLYTEISPSDVTYTNQQVSQVYSRPTVQTTYTFTASNGTCSTPGSTIVAVNPLPTFTVSPITICNGSSGILSAVSAENNSYSWTGGLSGQSVSVSPTVDTTYQVVATSNTTTPACSSAPVSVLVSVNNQGSITQQPTNQIAATTFGATFTVAGTLSPVPVPYTYQWQIRTSTTPSPPENDPTGTWSNVVSSSNYSGETTNTLTISNASTAINGTVYRCILTPLSPCAPLVSSSATLTVTSVGTTNPQNLSICLPASTNPLPQFNVVTSGSGTILRAQWEVSTNNFATTTVIPLYLTNGNLISSGYTGPNTTAVPGLTFEFPLVLGVRDYKTLMISGIDATTANNYRFRVKFGVSGANVLPIVSQSASLTINSPVVISTDLNSTPIVRCQEPASVLPTVLSISTTGTVQSVVWKYATTAGASDASYSAVTDGVPAGATYSSSNPSTGVYQLSVTTTSATPLGNYYYKAFLTGVSPCSDSKSAEATISVTRPTVTVPSSTAAYCTPGPAVTLSASGASTYAWTPTTSLSPADGLAASVSASPSSTTLYTVTGTDGNGCTNTATVNVTTGSSLTATATNASVLSCPNTSIALTGTAVSADPIYSINTGGYKFSANSGTFTPLSGGTAAPSITTTSDDALSNSIPIGFNFNYGGTSYANFKVSSNGLLTFNTTGDSTNSNDLASAANVRPGLAPLWDDLQPTAGVTYQVSGSVGSRVLTVEWLNMEWNFQSATAVISFQAKLYETTNIIEYVYRQDATAYNAGSSGGATIGLMGTSTSNFISLQNVSASPTISTSASTNNIATKPATGQVYRFTPAIPITYSYAWTSTPSSTIASVASPTVTPSVATTYNLTVTSSEGCSASASPLLVNVQAAPAITAHPQPTTKCSGTTATFSVTATSTAAMSYQWFRVGTPDVQLANSAGVITGATSATLNLIGVTTANNGEQYYVRVTNCSTQTTTSNPATLIVNPLPAVTLSPSTATYCSPGGTAVALTAGGAGTSNYTYTNNTSLSPTTGANVSATPLTTTTYTVTGTDVNGCTNTASSTITVAPAVLMQSITATPSSVCSGSSSQLNVVAGTTAAYTMTAGTFGLLTPTGTVTNTATGDDALLNTVSLPFNVSFFGVNYSNILIYSNGYAAFQTGVTGSPYVQAIPNTTSPDNFIAISHDDLNVTVAGQVSYFTNGTAPNRIFVINYNGVKYYNSAANNGNLTGQIQIFEADQHIEIHVQNSVDPTLSAKSLGIENVGGTLGYAPASRNNTSYDITIPEAWKFNPSGGTLSYAWTESPTLPTTLSATNIVNPMANGITSAKTYSVTVSGGGCSATGGVTPNVNALPTASISGNTSFCPGGSTLLNSNATAGSGTISTYQWKVGGVNVASAGTSATYTATAAGSYTVTVTNSNGCSFTSAPYVVTINPLPTVTAANVSGCTGNAIALSGTPAGGTYSVANPYTGPSTTYTYTYTDGNGCTATSSSANITVSTNVTWYPDGDHDGYGTNSVGATTIVSCNDPSSVGNYYASNNIDCVDSNAAINPGVVETNFDSIDNNCSGSIFEGHAPVVVDVTTASGPLATMTATINSSTATNTSPYSGAQVTYIFKVTKTNAPTSVAYVSSSTTSFVFSSASNAAHSSTYDVQATAIVNGEEQPYNGNTQSYTTPAAPTLPNPPTQAGPPNVACAYTIARIDSYIYANNSTTYGANRYEFLIERMDNGNPVQTISVATTVPYFKLTNIAGIPSTLQVTYGTTYRISVRYGYGATSFGSQIYTAYGTPCLVSTPALPVASIPCGTTLASVNAYIYASGYAGGANQFEFKVTRISTQQPGELPITVTEETATRNVANFRLTMLNQLLIGLQKEYSVSVRYRVTAYGMDNYSAWSSPTTPCSVFTPDFPETQIVEAQCGVEGVPSTVNEYVYADAVAGATQYQFRLYNSVDLPYTEENPYDYTVYSPGKYVKLNQFPGLIAGVDYKITVVAQLYGEYPNIDLAKDCSITAPASTPSGPAKVVADVFKATAYPNPFANNFMIDVKTESQSVVNLKVYDMIGRLIEQREARVSDLETTTIGDRYPSGVYNVVVSQDEEVQTVRVVKR